jgi:hypothetical protein
MLLMSGCITPFIPETEEPQSLIVIEGLITDQPEVNTIKLSRSIPLGLKTKITPLTKCTVWITDDMGSSATLTESKPGVYVTNLSTFRGIVGRKYSLHVNTNNSYINHYSFSSVPVEMKPVPAIDSIYYEKMRIPQRGSFAFAPDGCQIYLDTHDDSGKCRLFRWDYSETWEIHIPFYIPVNRQCWVTETSDAINIKSTSSLSEDVIKKFPVRFISNESDRLRIKYSILLNQYSLSTEEFAYWDKLKAVTQEVGSLYDITPASIPNNLYCEQDPSVEVLGYFSVSARKSKRIFIDDNFFGQFDAYADCVADTLPGTKPDIPGLNSSAWILDINFGPEPPPWTTFTYFKGCADCTVRGSKVKPDFWK